MGASAGRRPAAPTPAEAQVDVPAAAPTPAENQVGVLSEVRDLLVEIRDRLPEPAAVPAMATEPPQMAEATSVKEADDGAN